MHPVKALLGDVATVNTDHKYRWYLMRGIGRFHRLRGLGRYVSRPPENGASPNPGQQTLFPEASRERVLGDLRRDGFAGGLELPFDALAEVLAYAEATPFWANRNPSLPLMRRSERADVERASRTRVYLGEYRRPEECPVVDRIGRDPFVLDVARAYLGVAPRLISSELWWSFAAGHGEAEQSAAAQLFHFDLDDFRQLKLFFYLTDVDESGGPHVAVRGTHASKRLAHEVMIRRLPDEEVARVYGPEAIRRFCMRAGRGFFEDTFCLHKGQAPSGADRLMMAFNFGINDFYRAGF
jgi:hypothetical protein